MPRHCHKLRLPMIAESSRNSHASIWPIFRLRSISLSFRHRGDMTPLIDTGILPSVSGIYIFIAWRTNGWSPSFSIMMIFLSHAALYDAVWWGRRVRDIECFREVSQLYVEIAGKAAQQFSLWHTPDYWLNWFWRQPFQRTLSYRPRKADIYFLQILFLWFRC